MLSQKQYIKDKITILRSTAFLVIAIAITALTNKYRSKNSLLWWKILVACDIRCIRVRILRKLDVPRHRDSKTEKPQHRDSETKKPRYLVSAKFWPLYLLILPSAPQRLKNLNKFFPFALGIFIWWYVDCSAPGLYITRLKRKSNIKKKNCVLILRK